MCVHVCVCVCCHGRIHSSCRGEMGRASRVDTAQIDLSALWHPHMPHPRVQDENRGGRGKLLGRGQVERSRQENPTSGRVETRAAKGITVSHGRAVFILGNVGRVEGERTGDLEGRMPKNKKKYSPSFDTWETHYKRLSHVLGTANLKWNNSGSDWGLDLATL